MINYLVAMTALQEVYRALRHTPSDQGIHNYLIRHNVLKDNMLIFPQQNHMVYTVGGDTWTIEQDRLITSNGTFPSVIHQWDRLPQLAQWVLKRFQQDLQHLGIQNDETFETMLTEYGLLFLA